MRRFNLEPPDISGNGITTDAILTSGLMLFPVPVASLRYEQANVGKMKFGDALYLNGETDRTYPTIVPTPCKNTAKLGLATMFIPAGFAVELTGGKGKISFDGPAVFMSKDIHTISPYYVDAWSGKAKVITFVEEQTKFDSNNLPYKAYVPEDFPVVSVRTVKGTLGDPVGVKEWSAE